VPLPSNRRQHEEASGRLPPCFPWFSVVSELHRDWRNDVEGLKNILLNHVPAYRNLITSYLAKKS